MIKLIVALDDERGIGKNNGIPWFIPGELGWVAKTTKQTSEEGKMNALIMGRKTWESLPEDRRPLPGRVSIVITRSPDKIKDSGIYVCSSLEAAIDIVEQSPDIEHGFIFGGAGIYAEALEKGMVKSALLTYVPGTHDADTFFPELPADFSLVDSTTQEYGDVSVRRENWVV